MRCPCGLPARPRRAKTGRRPTTCSERCRDNRIQRRYRGYTGRPRPYVRKPVAALTVTDEILAGLGL